MREIGFKGGYADPCLLTRKTDKGICYIALYVDDCYCAGTTDAIEEVIKELQSPKHGYTLKLEYDMTDYLSCHIAFSKKRDKAWLGQPHLIAKLEKTFKDLVKDLTTYKTPGTPHQGILRIKNEPNTPKIKESMIGKDNHKLYRSGVGMLLYLVKHSRPDIGNAVRELSKVLDNPTPAAFKEMKRVIKYVLDTKEYGLKLFPNQTKGLKEFEMVLYTDSDWAGDKDTRISVSGYCIFLQGVPISWKSKAQRSGTLEYHVQQSYWLYQKLQNK